jgi:hypothetical protein
MTRVALCIGLVAVLSVIPASAADVGEQIPAIQHRFTDNRFNLDDLGVKLISADEIEVKVTMSAAAAECANLPERDSPWMHLTFLTADNHRYDVSNIMLVQVPESHGYYHHHTTVNVRDLADEMPSINRVSAWMGQSVCNP